MPNESPFNNSYTDIYAAASQHDDRVIELYTVDSPREKLIEKMFFIEGKLRERVEHCTPYYSPCLAPRWCPTCCETRHSTLLGKYGHLLLNKYMFHLTLSTPASWYLQSGILRKLGKAIAKLRRRRSFDHNVMGGLANIQLAWSPNGYGWLVHVHMLIEVVHPVELEMIRTWWRKLTGGEQVSLIPIVPGDELAEFKYGTRFMELPLNAHQLRAFYHEAHGFRFTRAWGSFRKSRWEGL
jgi:hypothetical protein